MKKITIFGGDNRMKTVYELLQVKGFKVDSYGLFTDDFAVMQTSDIFLLPVPATKDGVNVYAPLTNKSIPLDRVCEAAEKRPVLIGNHTLEGVNCIDYCKSDAYSLKNAVPTAEGAIAIAIENTPFTLWNSKCLVIGYGRVGKVLAERLKGMHCFVTVSSRRLSEKALLETAGYEHIFTADAPNKAQNYDIIFNTIDIPILEDKIEALTGKLVIDLSTKGCFNHNTAKALGVCAIKAPGLPGKTAPQTAGKILTETVLEIIEDLKID